MEKSSYKSAARYLIRYGYDQYLIQSGVFMIGLALVCRVLVPPKTIREEITTSNNALAEAMSAATTQVNNSGTDQTVVLKCGSKVRFATGGSISFPTNYGDDQRIVTLAGNAHFQVTNIPEKPLLVYAGTLVSRCAGGTFQVRAMNKDTLVGVTVNSGKIEVFRAEDFDNVAMEAKNADAGVRLNTAQKTIFLKNARTFKSE